MYERERSTSKGEERGTNEMLEAGSRDHERPHRQRGRYTADGNGDDGGVRMMTSEFADSMADSGYPMRKFMRRRRGQQTAAWTAAGPPPPSVCAIKRGA